MARLAFLVLAVTLVGCASRLSPPYRDYEVRAEPPNLTGQLREAAVEAGWEMAVARDTAIVTTARQRVAPRTDVELDLVPLSGGYVRVYVRAERRSLLGGRSKLYALDADLRASVLGPLSDALRTRGLVPLGTPRDRDEDATE